MKRIFEIIFSTAATFYSPVDSFTAMAPSIKLTYFDIEGIAESVRLALILSGTDFEDDRIQFPEWSALKPTTPFGQLPLMVIDGAPARTQSGGMLRWAGSTLSPTLYPSDRILDIEEAMGIVDDMFKSYEPCTLNNHAERYGYPQGFGKTEECKTMVADMRKKWVEEQLPKYLTFLSDLIEKNDGGFLASKEAPTIADCKAIPMLRSFTRGHIDYISTDCLEVNPKIVDYIKRFCALQPLQGRYTNGIF